MNNPIINQYNLTLAPSQSEPGPASAAQAARSDASLCPFQPGDASQASGGKTLTFFSSPISRRMIQTLVSATWGGSLERCGTRWMRTRRRTTGGELGNDDNDDMMWLPKCGH